VPVSVPHRAQPGWDGHLLLFYRSERERLTRLAEWVRYGLDRGEKVVYVEPGDIGPDSVAVQLREHLDTDALLAEGRLEIVPPEAYYPVGAPQAVVDRVLAEGFPAVRISGTADSALGVVTAAGHRDVEWGVDRLCRTRPVSALCQYAYPATTGPLRAALDTHPGGFRELSLAGRGIRSDIVLHGSVDRANVEVLSVLVGAAAEAVTAAGLDRLHVDLTGVGRVAPTACTAVASASEPFRRAGGSLVLDGADPAVEQALRVSGLAGLPGVELAAVV
jgi:anti-anti-sigma regulatory factor